jgi:hypothetical protein
MGLGGEFMKNTLPLLVMVRLEPAQHADQLFNQLSLRLTDVQGSVIDASTQQALWYCPDPREALDIISALFDQGERHRFNVSAGLVQAVAATSRVPDSPADFTEATLSTLLELAGTAGPQQAAISGKLLSLLQFAVPHYARCFEPSPSLNTGGVKIRQAMLMSAQSVRRMRAEV